MMRQTGLLFFLITLLQLTASSQQFQWVREGGWIGQDAGRSVATDTFGNVYATGYFAGKAEFYGDTFVVGNGTFEMYLAKYNTNGDMLWLKHAGSDERDAGNGVTVDQAGNAYVAGYFTNTAIFDSVTSVTSRGDNDIFIAKYNTHGHLQWVKTAGGVEEDRAFSIAYDNRNGLYVTGYFRANAFFGNQTVQSNGDNDLFVARYDTNGNLIWVQSMGDVGVDNGLSITVDSKGNACVAGFFYFNADFGNGVTIPGRGLSSEGFVARYQPDGTCDRAKVLGGPFTDAAYGVAVDKSDNVYVTGYYLDTAHFEKKTLAGNGYNDIFLVKYDTAWTEEWVNTMGGPFLDIGTALDADDDGNVYVTGTYDSLSDFGGTFLSGPQYDQNIFVAKYNTKGGLAWVIKAGGEEGDFGNDLVLDRWGNIFITGLYYFRAKFSDISARGTSRDKPFLYIAKLSPFNTGINTITAAGNYLLYPNPNTGNFHIRIPSNYTGSIQVALMDIQGKVITQTYHPYPANNLEVNLPPIPKGIYLVRLETEGVVITRRVVIQ